MKLTFSAATAVALFSVTAWSAPQKNAELSPGTSVPVVLTQKIDAAKAHPGDPVTGRTTQSVTLASGEKLPKGALLQGHVIAATPFQFNPAHYAVQQNATLSIQFDTLTSGGSQIPLHVYVRALADPVTVNETRMPKSSDLDSLGTLTLVGGDQVIPSQDEIRSAKGDVVGYKHDGGNYAHLIARRKDGASCDGGSTEQAIGVFSASACGAYGFAEESVTTNDTNVVTLVSNHYTPRFYANTAILLEAQPATEASNKRP